VENFCANFAKVQLTHLVVPKTVRLPCLYTAAQSRNDIIIVIIISSKNWNFPYEESWM